MSHKLAKSDFHKIILVVCQGSKDREEFEFCMNAMFEIDDKTRNYYWESYCEAQGVLRVLNLLGADMSLSTEHGQTLDEMVKKPPDNVIPIKPEVL